WGQGLIALRDEVRRRGIRHLYVTYHGTTDPSVYGIADSVYFGGPLPSGAEWLAVSSYYFRGLGQRMTTLHGFTRQVWFDFEPMAHVRPVARPARCMYLFRVDRSDPEQAAPGRVVNIGQ